MNVKLLSSNAKMPTRGSEEAAGFDLYAATDSVTVIPAHETVLIPTDIAIEIPKGMFGGIFARSGLASNRGLRPANCVGVIDSDYRGNVKVALHNDTDEDKVIDMQERIAQLIIIPYVMPEIREVQELSNTSRGSDGFGSTGTI
jgi:dUTP pyrophosphatase